MDLFLAMMMAASMFLKQPDEFGYQYLLSYMSRLLNSQCRRILMAGTN